MVGLWGFFCLLVCLFLEFFCGLEKEIILFFTAVRVYWHGKSNSKLKKFTLWKQYINNLFSSFLYFKYVVLSPLLAASLWGPYKDIWQTVMNAIWKRQPEAVHRLDQVLKKHKSDFISLFRNPVLDLCSLLEWAGELMIYCLILLSYMPF